MVELNRLAIMTNAILLLIQYLSVRAETLVDTYNITEKHFGVVDIAIHSIILTPMFANYISITI